MFDTREYLKSLEPPTFVSADGRPYVGRVLSLHEWQRFEPRMAAARAHKLAGDDLRRLIEDLVGAFFPRGRKFWTRDFWQPVAWHIRKLPPIGQLRACYDFMRSQGRALGTELPEPQILGTPQSPQPTSTGGESPGTPPQK